MYWADKIAKKIIDSAKFTPYWVDDMKTPSGFAHVGSLRGPLIHSVIYRALKDAGKNPKFTFVFNDFDSADELPFEYKEEFKDYLGLPLKKVPSPHKDFHNLADFLVDDLGKVLRQLGVEAEFISSWELYHQGKFDEVIKMALDHAEKIQDLYQKISGSQKKAQGWLPLQVVCEKCGKLGTTRVFAWDGKEVSYKCEPNLVTWAKGCGHEGKISPFGGNGKLPWKVDWPAHWKVIGVTVEGAGKDHASAGGSYDIAMELCKEVFNYPQPFKFPYEFILIGGKKMSSSKGLGMKARDILNLFPPHIARFMFTRQDYREQVNFDPVKTMAIPDLFDEYDRCYYAFLTRSDEDLARAFELAQVKTIPPKKEIYLPRFREIAQVIQMPKVDPKKYFSEKKGSDLNSEEKEILGERIKYAEVWLEKYAPNEASFKIQTIQGKAHITFPKEFFGRLIKLIEASSSPEELEKKLYELIKEFKYSSKEVFSEIYSLLIGKTHGPKAAWLIWENKKEVMEKFKKILER